MTRAKSSKAALLCSAALLILTVSATAQARDINIPAEDLKTALDSYIRQSGVQLVYTVNDVDGLRSSAVEGHYEPIQALDKLLQGTQLAANRDATGAVIVSKRLAAAADAEPAGAVQGVETVTVTGSRVISDIANSPTPLTAVSAEQLQATTPTTIPDALNKLPVFFGSSSQRSGSTSSRNSQGNYLNLRNFGANRTLVLVDGHRVAPSNFDGTIDTDVLPQTLVQRVDVVTGGASAVYGSDAVTGVVNFVLDKKFEGLKYNANAGISKYTDAATYQISAAAGTDIFGGRGHIEGSVRVYHQDAVPITSRPYGAGNQAWSYVGAGTAASPYVMIQYTRKTTQARGGGIVTCTCSANNSIFVSNGVLAPFNFGTPTPTTGLAIGGDGGTNNSGASFQASLRTEEAFGRLSYDLNNATTAYVQLTASQANNYANHAPATINPGPGRGNIFYANNAYLPPATQAQLTAGNAAGTFNFAQYFDNVGGQPIYSTGDDFSDGSIDRYLSMTAGLTGSLFDKYSWDLYFTHGENRQEEYIPHNNNIQKLIAGEDAVLDPSGKIVCHVMLTASASKYPGCVPINPFGPDSLTEDQFNWFTDRTSYIATNTMDDIGGSITTDFPGLPAGDIKAAVSGEARWQSMVVQSAFDPGKLVDCTDLRLCTPPYATLYDQPTVAPVNASYNVYEFNAEVNVPLLKDIPMIQQLNLDLAGRYTNYSTSGGVETWKIGLDYHVNDSIRFRGTDSVDIRAPSLFDLYQPLTISTGGFNDQLTKVNLSIVNKAQGNSALIPEVAHTYTAGVVLTPDFLPGFTASVDYYRINMSQAITSLSGNNPDLQKICIASGGTSLYCSLANRSFPYTNTTPANFPNFYLTESINSASVRTEGTDVELDYNFDMDDLLSGTPGSVSLRNLTSYQPFLTTINYPGSPNTLTPMPKLRDSFFFSYKLGNWGVDVQDTWFGGFSPKTLSTLVFAQPHVSSFNLVDATIDREFMADNTTVDLYFSVQNIFNTQPPLFPPINPGPPGAAYPVLASENGMGRYFIIGLRGEL